MSQTCFVCRLVVDLFCYINFEFPPPSPQGKQVRPASTGRRSRPSTAVSARNRTATVTKGTVGAVRADHNPARLTPAGEGQLYTISHPCFRQRGPWQRNLHSFPVQVTKTQMHAFTDQDAFLFASAVLVLGSHYRVGRQHTQKPKSLGLSNASPKQAPRARGSLLQACALLELQDASAGWVSY